MYVKALTEIKEKCKVSQQGGSEEVYDNCMKDKHTYHIYAYFLREAFFFVGTYVFFL